MIGLIQAHYEIILGAIVAGTVVWAVVSSLVPPRRHKLSVRVTLPAGEAHPAPARSAAVPD